MRRPILSVTSNPERRPHLLRRPREHCVSDPCWTQPCKHSLESAGMFQNDQHCPTPPPLLRAPTKSFACSGKLCPWPLQLVSRMRTRAMKLAYYIMACLLRRLITHWTSGQCGLQPCKHDVVEHNWTPPEIFICTCRVEQCCPRELSSRKACAPSPICESPGRDTVSMNAHVPDMNR